MLSFLYTHCKKHKPSLLTISGAAGSSIGFLWGFDIQKLTPSGTLSPELMWQLRMFLTPIIISLYFLTLLVLTLYHYKKDMEPITITPGDRERFLKALNHDKEEIELLKEELILHKKYLKQYAPTDFDIVQAEEYEKGWNEAGKHLKESITLDNQKVNVLVFLAMQNDPITAETISTRLVIHIQTVLLHLNELKELNMVKCSTAYPKGDDWSITSDGRKYLSKNNLLP